MAKITITIAGMQMLVSNNVLQNEKRILAAIKRTAKDRPDFLLTPEGSLSGYHAEFSGAKVAAAEKRVACLTVRGRKSRRTPVSIFLPAP